MPIYEYQCTSCGIRFERKQSIHDQPISECPECNGYTRKVLHPVGIIFKGSGWYVTDSKRSDTGTIAPGEPARSKDGESEKRDSSAASETPAKDAVKEPAKAAAKEDTKASTAQADS